MTAQTKTADSENAVATQHHRPTWPDFSELFAGLPTWAEIRRPGFAGHHPIKIEDELADGTYTAANPSQFDIDVRAFASSPEPATLATIALGGIALRRRRRRVD